MADAAARGSRWSGQAARDLSDAEYLRAGGRHNTACFMAHQAAVKALTGYLYAEGAEAVWGSSVADLCEDAGVFDQAFFVLKADTVFLDKYASATLRPDMLPGALPADVYDDLESGRALELAGQVLEFVAARTGQP